MDVRSTFAKVYISFPRHYLMIGKACMLIHLEIGQELNKYLEEYGPFKKIMYVGDGAVSFLSIRISICYGCFRLTHIDRMIIVLLLNYTE